MVAHKVGYGWCVDRKETEWARSLREIWAPGQETGAAVAWTKGVGFFFPLGTCFSLALSGMRQWGPHRKKGTSLTSLTLPEQSHLPNPHLIVEQTAN